MKNIEDFSVASSRVLVRCDFNVPLDKDGNILDDFKIKQTLPTIKYLMDGQAKIILMSHLDPESTGMADPKFTLDRVAEKLSEYLSITIEKEDDCIGPNIENETNKLKSGQVLLLENLRFHREEKENDPEFAKKLSYLGDVYVNDAFGSCHRTDASIVGVPKNLPNCAGLLLKKEIATFEKVLKSPEKPLVVLIGGKKVETKAKFIDNISEVADYVIVSGLIAKEISEKNIKFKYPGKIIVPVGDLAAPDINEESVKIFCEKIALAKTVLWNGPFGRFEEKKDAEGTLSIAKAIIKSEAFSIVGGGETVEFLNKQGMIDKFTHVSTGGGAMLAYLSGDELPGLRALEK